MEDNFDKLWDALGDSKRAEIDPVFLHKMETLSDEVLQKSSKISMKSILGIAASLLLLISINVYVLNENSRSMASETIEISNQDYRLIPNPLI